MLKHFVWVSFDLGIKGDYEGMYAWLDRQSAKECGDSVAGFWYEHSGDLLETMKADINENVEIDQKKSRVYVVRLVDGKMKGSFIFGHRRSAPWTGFGGTAEQDEDDA